MPAIVAPPAVPWWKLSSRPTTTLSEPSSTDMAMIAGTRCTRSDAVAGGPISSPNTSSVPMAWKLATMLTARSTSSAAWARAGWSPSDAALARLKVRARKGR